MTILYLDIMKDDFQEPFNMMLMKMLHKVDKYGLSYQTNDDISYYLNRLKGEIEEFEKNPSLDESLDIANFAIMMVYHLQPREDEEE